MASSSEYGDDEIRAILRRALQQERDGVGLTHEELEEVAAEVGIAPEDLADAARAVAAERAQRKDLEEAEARVAAKTRKRRRGWWRHVATWGVVSGGLALLDWVMGGGWWAHFPAIGWGIFVGLHGVRTFFRDREEDLQRELIRLRKKRERAARKRARERDRQSRKGAMSRAEEAFEDAIERGITLLLEKAADSLDRATREVEQERPDTAFNRYVDGKEGRKKGAKKKRARRGTGPRARVDGPGAEAAPEEVEVGEPAARRREREA